MNVTGFTDLTTLLRHPASAFAWQDRAACAPQTRDSGAIRREADRYFPAGRLADRTRQTCLRCPVRAECLQYAIDNDEEGMWAATTQAERRALMRKAS